MSLKTVVGGFQTHTEVEKVYSVLIKISGFVSQAQLLLEYPGKFDKARMMKYIGAELKDDLKNDQASLLYDYWQKTTRDKFKEYEDPVSFEEINEVKEVLERKHDLDNYDFLVLNLKQGQQDLCMEVMLTVMRSPKLFIAALFVFPLESLQFETLTCLRNMYLGEMEKVKILPVYFNSLKQKIEGEMCENLEFGILFGKFSILLPPLKRSYSSICYISEIVEKICPPLSKIAMISDEGLQMIQVHSSELEQKVRYFGAKSDLSKFKALLAKDKTLHRSVSGGQGMTPSTSADSSSKSQPAETNSSRDGFEVCFPSNLLRTRKSSDESTTSPYKIPTSTSSLSEVGMKAGRCHLGTAFNEDKVSTEESVSSLQPVESDPVFLQLVAREKLGADMLAIRAESTPKGRRRDNMEKMAVFSQHLVEGALAEEWTDRAAGSMLQIPKLKNHCSKRYGPVLPEQPCLKRKHSDDDENIDPGCKFLPSIDEILRIPDPPLDGSRTMNEVLDEMDIKIATRKQMHDEEMASVDSDIEALKLKEEEREKRFVVNGVRKERLRAEVTETVLRRMFKENTEYF